MQISAIWRDTKMRQHYQTCVLAGSDLIIQCWIDENEGIAEFVWSTGPSESVNLAVSRLKGQALEIIATEEIDVYIIKERRRRRHPWELF